PAHARPGRAGAADRPAARHARGAPGPRARPCRGAVPPLVAGRPPPPPQRAADVPGPDDCDLHAGLQAGRKPVPAIVTTSWPDPGHILDITRDRLTRAGELPRRLAHNH